jgi:hypothetical protein
MLKENRFHHPPLWPSGKAFHSYQAADPLARRWKDRSFDSGKRSLSFCGFLTSPGLADVPLDMQNSTLREVVGGESCPYVNFWQCWAAPGCRK